MYRGEALRDGTPTNVARWKIIRREEGATSSTERAALRGAFDGVWDERTTYFGSSEIDFENTHSLNFDGVNEYITFGDNYDFSPAQAFSLSFWVKPQNLAAQRCFLSKTTDDSNVHGVGIYHNSSGQVFIQMRAPGQNRQHTFGDTLTAGVWQHICVTYDGGQNMGGLNVYINGSLDSGSPASSASISNSLETDTPLYLGRRGSSFYYSGNMNQVSRWNKELSAAEVAQVYNAGIPSDLSNLSAFGNCTSWWYLSSPGDYPTEIDRVGSIDGTLMNHEVGDYEAGDVPA